MLRNGRNRFAFGLFDRGNRQIADLGSRCTCRRAVGGAPRAAPTLARFEPIKVSKRFLSRQTVDDPDAALSVYVAHLPLPSRAAIRSRPWPVRQPFVVTSPTRSWSMTAARGRRPAIARSESTRPPDPQPAATSRRSRPASLRTPCTQVDLADALDKHRPVLLLFATPALCQSRVCGPVTDVAEELKSEFGGKVDFIHMEIYVNNELERGPPPPVPRLASRQGTGRLRDRPPGDRRAARGSVLARRGSSARCATRSRSGVAPGMPGFARGRIVRRDPGWPVGHRGPGRVFGLRLRRLRGVAGSRPSS